MLTWQNLHGQIKIGTYFQDMFIFQICLKLVIVLHIMKLLFGTFQINLYYMKLSPKQRIHATSMQTFLILS